MNLKWFEIEANMQKAHWKQWVFILARYLLIYYALKFHRDIVLVISDINLHIVRGGNTHAEHGIQKR